MTAKKYLMQYKECNDRLKSLEAERSKLFDNATNISPTVDFKGVSIGITSDKVGYGAARLADIAVDIANEIADKEHKLKEIRGVISKVEPSVLQDLLRYKYACGYDWDQVAENIGYNTEYIIKKLHPKALDEVDKIINIKLVP